MFSLTILFKYSFTAAKRTHTCHSICAEVGPLTVISSLFLLCGSRGIELESSGLEASPFVCWAILLAQGEHFLRTNKSDTRLSAYPVLCTGL